MFRYLLIALLFSGAANAKVHLKNIDFQADSLNFFAAADSGNAFIVEFTAPLSTEDRKIIADNGGEIHKYIPDNAFIMTLTEEAWQLLSTSEKVASLNPMQSSYRLQGKILARLSAKNMSVPTVGVYNVMPVDKKHNEALAQKIEVLGGKVAEFSKESSYLVAALSDEQLLHIAGDDQTLWIDEKTEGGHDMNNALIQGGAAGIRGKHGQTFRGRGIRGHVLEGIFADHRDFAANEFRKKPIGVGKVASDWHGTNTYSLIFSNGIGNEKAAGLMPDGQGYYTHDSHVRSKVGMRFEFTKMMIEKHQIMFQTASWGGGITTEYTVESAELDDLIFKLNIPITTSMSNWGTRAARPEAWAKNSLGIGGVNHGNNPNPEDDSWGGASIGPAEDGRIKPDLVGYYDSTEAAHGPFGGYTNDFGGTSGATPMVAGHLGLMIEIWGSGVLGNQSQLAAPANAQNMFANRPQASTAKAMLINSARQYKFSGEGHNMTRVHQGWGFPNLANMVNSRNHLKIVNEDDILLQGQTRTYEFNVNSENPNFKVTLVYMDPASSPSASKHLINDLDLKVTSPSGKVYYGNNGLKAGMFSSEGGSPNRIDNVENVFINAPEKGLWTVEVHAHAINEDGHLETSEIDADYALVIRN